MAAIHEIQYAVNYSLPPLFKFEVFRNFQVFRGSAPSQPVRELHVNSRVCALIHVYAYFPLHLPKQVTQKPSVNHIGSSNEPPKIGTAKDKKSSYLKSATCVYRIMNECPFIRLIYMKPKSDWRNKFTKMCETLFH